MAMRNTLKMTLMLAAGFIALGGVSAQAQDSSYYTMQVPRTMATDPIDQAIIQRQAYERQLTLAGPRGGRDPRAGFYGRASVWPGDYHDALDRGSWPAGDRKITIAPQRQWPD